MEIKVQCPCGTKYKFEVEPVNNRMPMPVSCPACGADGTALANEFLRASQTAPTPQVQVRAVPVARPVAAPAPVPRSPSQPPIPPPIGPAGAAAATVVPPRVATPPIVVVAPPKPATKSTNVLVGTLIALCFLAFMGYGTWKVCSKWFKRFQAAAEIASVLGKKLPESTTGPKNLCYDDSVVLFVRHTNHLEIAQACQAYWKEKLGRNLIVTESPDIVQAKGEYQLIPPHNGYVRIFGSLEWAAPQFEALSLHLSQNFNTLVFEVQDVDFSGAYHFGVYDSGARKFHAKMEVNITENDVDEVVTTDGNDWALANGYKPGPEGFKAFDLGDADQITQRLGMKFWDEPEGTELRGLLLKE
jgi:hypothetical protein